MDVRGIEVTNQLRSAIRAKLLELGVRYDEELPDYILVMVVNKKSRQQMHEDLNLFLENNTTPFVNWLHDQVLKKLQKVTIAKKKPSREFVPTVIVKQEEERKKKRSIIQLEEKSKEELVAGQSPVKTVENGLADNIVSLNEITRIDNPSMWSPPSPPPLLQPSLLLSVPQHAERSTILINNSSSLLERSEKCIDTVSSSFKRISERETDTERPEKKLKTSVISRSPLKEPEETEPEERRIKSCVNKPRITSVVSVKTRLGFISPRKNIQVHKDRNGDNYRRRDTRFEKTTYENVNRRNSARGRSFEDGLKRNREESNIHPCSANNKNRISGGKELTEKTVFTMKSRIESTAGNIKDRLGQVPKLRMKDSQQDNLRNCQNRIGTVTSKFRALGRLGAPRLSRDDDLYGEDGDADEDDSTAVPVKSHIIAIKSTTIEKEDRRNVKIPRKLEKNDEKEEENDEQKSLASKVIVTPRPLKPLQPVQKRATQSLLLRAVAEANQSVVKQKNPEPISKEKKPIHERLRTSGTREIAQNLSVHINATKRLVMEKIQVELTNPVTSDNHDPEPYVPRSVTEEQMGVVMSLFQRGDDNQKFLVTLNGYNNNGIKEKNLSDDDERLEMEVNEEDELVLSIAPNDSSPDDFQTFELDELDTSEKIEELENNENHCSDNLTIKDSTRKRRKLSPIIYTRSPSPNDIKYTAGSSSSTGLEKRSPVASVIVSDTSREKCWYWPNCTLGKKCAYLHPAVNCSTFPTCKFGDKCAYKHPECKFGLSCTKLGCIFSHPSQQCKYHPYCKKQGCMYIHPSVHSTVPADATRAKFTWRRRD